MANPYPAEWQDSGQRLTNYSKTNRIRLHLNFGIGYSSDIDQAGIVIPFPRRDIHLFSQSDKDADISSLAQPQVGKLRRYASVPVH